MSRRLALLSLFIGLILVVVDWQDRLLVTVNEAESLTDPEQLRAFPDLQLTKAERDRMRQRYDLYTEDEAGSAQQQSQGMTAEQQAQQQGELTEVYVEDKKLSLKAIITQGLESPEPYALLRVTTLSDNSSQIEKVGNGESAYGYRLQVVNNTRVAMYRLTTDSDKGAQPDISLVMYRRQGIAAQSGK